MGRATSGGSCPFCGNYVSYSVRKTLYRHKGNVSALVGSSRRECRASGATLDVARRMRANKDAGRHPYRCADGSWLYVCDRCGREQHPWPVQRPPLCSPKDWAHCIRPLPQISTTEARNEE